MIDRSFIGLELPPIVTEVERGRLRSFAKAIGETNPMYFLPMLSALKCWTPIRSSSSKKNGALDFIVQDTEARDENGQLMVELRRRACARSAPASRPSPASVRR